MSEAYDLIVIGTGPGGYVCAIRAAQLGLKTAVVEKRATHGGTCLNVGCIPSKALLHASEAFEEASKHFADLGISVGTPRLDLRKMMSFKDEGVDGNVKGVEFLLKKNKVASFQGTARIAAAGKVEIRSEDGSTQTLDTKNIVIATGSDVTRLPGLEIDEKVVVSSTGALDLDRVPKKLLIIGAGVIGLELGSVWRRLGAKVTVVDIAPTVLPGNDADVVKEAEKIFRKQGLEFRLGVKVTGAERHEAGVRVAIEKDGTPETLDADYVLVSVGRRPALGGIDAEALGLALGRRGEIVADHQLRTNIPNVYAIGDAIGGKLLAHKAEDEGVIAAEVIAGMNVHMHYRSMPSVVYTHPEIATVGLAEHEVVAEGRKFRVGKFPLSANGRARTMGDTAGFVKVIADTETDELLGVHMIAPNASDLIAEVVLAFEYRGAAEDLGVTVHAHPTLSEATKEAALAALGRAIHI